MSVLSAADVQAILVEKHDAIVSSMNTFMDATFRCRGGRIGSGFGTVIEGLWGFYANRQLEADVRTMDLVDVAWLGTNQYNDFAVVGPDWDLDSKSGEYFRIEAKSMNVGAVEAKGHFDQPIGSIGVYDLLLVPFWTWKDVGERHRKPVVIECYTGSARAIARFRDRLHIARGGSFVDRNSCPDKCTPGECQHHGEPLNSKGNRERRFGPVSTKGAGVPSQSNFGGLVRMTKTRSKAAQAQFDDELAHNPDAAAFVAFIRRVLAEAAAHPEVVEDEPPADAE